MSAKMLPATTQTALAAVEKFLPPVKADAGCDAGAFAKAHAVLANALRNQIKGGVTDEDRDLLWRFIAEDNYETEAVVRGIMKAIKTATKWAPTPGAIMEHISDAQGEISRARQAIKQAQELEEYRERQAAESARRAEQRGRLDALKAGVLEGDALIEAARITLDLDGRPSWCVKDVRLTDAGLAVMIPYAREFSDYLGATRLIRQLMSDITDLHVEVLEMIAKPEAATA